MDAEWVPLVDLYTGWGTPARFVVHGRAMLVGAAAGEEGTLLSALARNLRAFRARELKHAPLRIRVAGRTLVATTDEEGMFRLEASARGALDPGMIPVRAWVLGPDGQPREPVSTGQVQLCGRPLAIGVISDIDDTVLVTNVRQRIAMLKSTFLTGVDDLQAPRGMARLYRNIAANSRSRPVAFFYVSGSPLGLHRKLSAFLSRNRFPRGSLVMKKYGGMSLVPVAIRDWRVFSKMSHADPLFEVENYKVERVGRILESLPHVKFILIGDNGQRDPEAFARIRLDPRWKGRILGAYVRDVTGESRDTPRFASVTAFTDPREVELDLEAKRLLRAR